MYYTDWAGCTNLYSLLMVQFDTLGQKRGIICTNLYVVQEKKRGLLYMHCLDLVLGFCQPQPTKPKRQWSHRISMYVPELCLPQPTKPKSRWSHRISMYVPELFLPQLTKPKRWCALYVLKFKTASTYILSIVIVYALLTRVSAYTCTRLAV